MSKIRYLERKEPSSITRIMLSVVAGGVVGATTALLLAPKSGKKLRGDLYDAYEDMSDRGREFINDAVDRGQCAAKSAGEYADNMKTAARDFIRKAPEASSPNVNLIIGAVAGGCLGAAAIYLLSSKENEVDFAQKIRAAGSKISSTNWLDTARNVLDTIQQKVNGQHNGSEMEEGVHGHNKMQEVLEFASLGLRLWENIKKRR